MHSYVMDSMIVKRILITASMLLIAFAIIPVAIADTYACAEECNQCKSVCEKTLKHCTEMGGEHNQPEHIRALQDCIAMCTESAEFINRGSAMQKQVCNACMEACIRCADACSVMKNDKVMQKCARECRDCAKALKAKYGFNDEIHPVSSNAR